MPPIDQTVLVLGATGNQGGATATRLLSRGWRVRALTRNPSSAAAQSLAAAGADVIRGDLHDPDVLRAAMRGAYGVFSFQPTWVSAEMTPGVEPDSELRTGIAVADLAVELGVQHLVYASSLGADPEHELPSLRTKGRIEEHIRTTGIPATCLRPVSFMENYLGTSRALRVQDGKIKTAIAPHVRELLVAVADIGAFAELAFGDPERFAGQAFEIAGDRLTPPQIAAAVGAASGSTIEYEQIPIETLRAVSPRLARSFETINAEPYDVDIDALRRLHPELLSFAGWLRGIDRNQLAAGYPAAS
ncbi:MAG TPA: NmrA/HSCARG family protein [Mycobacteriales bacterium]|nr:NmrA/HSCARG family protein [Mycobacteriales bacterium]